MRMNNKMKKIVANFQEYVATYTNQVEYESYRDETFIDDMLYGIGIAMDEKYKFANGFDEWKEVLRKHLDNDKSATVMAQAIESRFCKILNKFEKKLQSR